jgi:Flp pilus assembly protein TadG
MTQPDKITDSRRRGSALVEFALAGSFILLPMLAGLVTVGLSLVTALQVANLNANAGQMFSSGADMSSLTATGLQNQGIIQAIASNANLTSGGVIVLSEIDDIAGAIVCSNQVVITIGSPTPSNYSGSLFATAPPSPGNYGSVLSPPFTMSLTTGQSAYVAETFFNSPYPWPFAMSSTPKGIYVRAIF